MNTIVVYVLVAYLGGVDGGGPMVIDNISSAQNCQAIRVALERDFYPEGYRFSRPMSRCYAVRKTVAK